ncbi:hypothetical protein [Paracraurococcus ruber]|uniref:Uncharacterized protein n=1 Tax=Paracraurococcus ruber TaxID=77675 RepID=A0ABS1CWZ0_9PROT|nr:hypothetical protein [Paracraurococcus ruber]MBK1658552.1 hypothetical protein [Paracraurococcus ruber]TDG30882.1 hypothetical protein E2C05_12745 [Paracraurococcus ruber]
MSSFNPKAIPGLQLSAVSADHSTAVFTSVANGIVPGDTDGLVDIFVQDLATGRITQLQPQAATSLLSPTVQILSLGIDAAGDRIVVQGLSGRDGDIAVFDRSSGREIQADVDALGQDIGTAFGPLLSPLGNYVYFGVGVQSTTGVLRNLSIGENTLLGPVGSTPLGFSAEGTTFTVSPTRVIALDPPPRPVAVTTTLDFEAFGLAPGAETKVVDYGGFHWNQAGAVNVGPQSVYAAGSGYTAASGSSIGFIAEAGGFEVDGYASPAGTALSFTSDAAFTLNAAAFSAAFRDGLTITVTAFSDVAGTHAIGSKAFVVDRDLLSLIHFDDGSAQGTFAGARRIEFASNDHDSSTSDYFGFDDLTFTKLVAPDPLL